MTKELYEILQRMKTNLVYRHSVTLSYKELSLIMKYITELEIEISGGNEED